MEKANSVYVPVDRIMIPKSASQHGMSNVVFLVTLRLLFHVLRLDICVNLTTQGASMSWTEFIVPIFPKEQDPDYHPMIRDEV